MVDLFEVYRRAKQAQSPSAPAPYYLAQDSHWSPAGMRLAAEAVADRLLERDWVARGDVAYSQCPAPVKRAGDVLQMLQVPQLQRILPPEICRCQQVVRTTDGGLYQDDPQAQLLVLGDSFLRVYQQDEPGGAGFVAHLAHALAQPLASIVSDGGGATFGAPAAGHPTRTAERQESRCLGVRRTRHPRRPGRLAGRTAADPVRRTRGGNARGDILRSRPGWLSSRRSGARRGRFSRAETMTDIKGDRLHVRLSASGVRRRLKGLGYGVRKIQSAGRNEAIIIHTATGQHLRELVALLQDVIVAPPEQE